MYTVDVTLDQVEQLTRDYLTFQLSLIDENLSKIKSGQEYSPIFDVDLEEEKKQLRAHHKAFKTVLDYL